jgi:hypothetical protein
MSGSKAREVGSELEFLTAFEKTEIEEFEEVWYMAP